MRSLITVIRAQIARFFSDSEGNIAIIFALSLIPILGTLGWAVDYSRASNARSFLQNAADSAALAALNKFETVDSVLLKLAQDTFNANLAQSQAPITAVPNVALGNESATITASTSMGTTLLGILNVSSLDVGVTSTAVKAPRVGPVCVLALNPTAQGSISVTGGASLTATGCVVHANSMNEYALETNGSANAIADTFCAVGGYDGVGFSPLPIKNCSKAIDPYENLSAPDSSGCDYYAKQFHKGAHTASPGIYCGGLRVHTHAVVTLTPGLYIIKDGPLKLLAHSTILGDGVTFYLTGSNAILDIKSYSSITLTAPTTGDYAGLAFVQDRDSSIGATSTLEGGGSIEITGAFYFPAQTLSVGGNGAISAVSPFMPMIANNLEFHGNAVISVGVDLTGGYPDDLTDVRTGSPRLIN